MKTLSLSHTHTRTHRRTQTRARTLPMDPFGVVSLTMLPIPFDVCVLVCVRVYASMQSDLDATTSRVHQLTLFIDTATRTVIHWGHRVAHRHRHKPITWLTRQHRQRLAPIAAHAAASLAQKSEMRIGLRVRARNVRRLHRAAEYWTRAVATAVHARGLFALEAGQQGMMISM